MRGTAPHPARGPFEKGTQIPQEFDAMFDVLGLQSPKWRHSRRQIKLGGLAVCRQSRIPRKLSYMDKLKG